MAACIFCALAPTLWMSCLCTSQKKAYPKMYTSAYPCKRISKKARKRISNCLFCGAWEIVATASHTVSLLCGACEIVARLLQPLTLVVPARLSQLRLCGACEIVATARLLQPLTQICLARNIIVCGSARNIIVCMYIYVWVFESMSVCVSHAIFVCAAPRAIKLVAGYTLAFILLTLSRTQ